MNLGQDIEQRFPLNLQCTIVSDVYSSFTDIAPVAIPYFIRLNIVDANNLIKPM